MLTSPSWTKFQDNLYTNKNLGFYLDLNNAELSNDTFAKMASTFDSAFSLMENLENGAISNPDEHRQVGHYWLRNPALAPTQLIRDGITEALSSIYSFSKQIIDGRICPPSGTKFSQVLVIGIGGSALGPQFIIDALGNDTGLNLHFLDNTDPDGMDITLQSISKVLDQTLVLVISKSGGTAETRNGMLETQNYFSQHGLDFSRQAVAITGEGSQLYELAKSSKWLEIFPMWDWVGGRTSIMSAVGLLPGSLAGINIDELLAGAKEMDDLTRLKDIKTNPAALLALSWYELGEGKGTKDMVVLPYKDRLLLLSRYLQQLIMESLGKSHDQSGNLVQQGIAVYGNKGSTDQHAYIQQLRDGLNNFFVTFIEVLKDREGSSIKVDGENTAGDYLFGFYKGTQSALYQNQRYSLTITIAELTPRSIGALIALYERAVGLYANLVNINAYHQPGVEAGKKAAGRVLDIKNRVIKLLGQSNDPMTISGICEALNLEGEEPLVYSLLRHFAANNDLKVEGSFYSPAELKVILPQENYPHR